MMNPTGSQAIAKLVRSLTEADPSTINAVADMIEAAAAAKSIEIDETDLPVDHRALKRVLELVGNQKRPENQRPLIDFKDAQPSGRDR